MEAYTNFAYVYDIMMGSVPYDEWAQYVKIHWSCANWDIR